MSKYRNLTMGKLNNAIYFTIFFSIHQLSAHLLFLSPAGPKNQYTVRSEALVMSNKTFFFKSTTSHVYARRHGPEGPSCVSLTCPSYGPISFLCSRIWCNTPVLGPRATGLWLDRNMWPDRRKSRSGRPWRIGLDDDNWSPYGLRRRKQNQQY